MLDGMIQDFAAPQPEPSGFFAGAPSPPPSLGHGPAVGLAAAQWSKSPAPGEIQPRPMAMARRHPSGRIRAGPGVRAASSLRAASTAGRTGAGQLGASSSPAWSTHAAVAQEGRRGVGCGWGDAVDLSSHVISVLPGIPRLPPGDDLAHGHRRQRGNHLVFISSCHCYLTFMAKLPKSSAASIDN